MPRPFALRRIMSEPEVTYFKPAGVPLRALEEIVLGVDEFEALRLVDSSQLGQKKAAEKMGVSQPTLSRMLSTGRKKVADTLAQGKALRIDGGSYKVRV